MKQCNLSEYDIPVHVIVKAIQAAFPPNGVHVSDAFVNFIKAWLNSLTELEREFIKKGKK